MSANGASELQTRIVVGALLIVMAGFALWQGGFAFWALATGGALIMLSEFGGLLKVDDKHRRLAMFALCIPLGIVAPLIAAPPGLDLGFFGFGALVGMAVAIITVFPSIVMVLPRMAFPT